MSYLAVFQMSSLVTCLVLQGISGNDTVGFGRKVPVDVNAVQVSLLDPE